MASERPFFAMMVFAILLVVFAHSVGCVRIPEWSNLNAGLCALGVSFIGINYVNEYMAKFPLSYRWVNCSIVSISKTNTQDK